MSTVDADMWAVSAMYGLTRYGHVETRNALFVVQAPSREAALATGEREAKKDLPRLTDIRVSAINLAQAIEARRAETAKTDSVEDESVVANGDVPKGA